MLLLQAVVLFLSSQYLTHAHSHEGWGILWSCTLGVYSNTWNGEGSGWEVDPVLTLWCERGDVLKVIFRFLIIGFNDLRGLSQP